MSAILGQIVTGFVKSPRLCAYNAFACFNIDLKSVLDQFVDAYSVHLESRDIGHDMVWDMRISWANQASKSGACHDHNNDEKSHLVESSK